MKKVVLWLSAVASVGAIALSVSTTACTQNGNCTFVSKCSGDAPMTADQMTTCENKIANAACGDKYNDYLGCFQNHQKCTEQGTTDETITNGTCGEQLAKYQSCCFGTDGGTADGGFPQCGQ